MYLNTHTYYSLCYGTIDTSELLRLGKECGVQQLVLTDINTTSACIDFVRKAPEYGIQPIVGIDFRNGAQQQFVCIAKNNEGFEEINNYLSALLHATEKCPDKAPEFKHVFIIYPFKKGKVYKLDKDEYIGVGIKDLPYIRLKNQNTDKMVVLHTVTFRTKKDFNAHRLLRAIDNNTLLSKLDPAEQGQESDCMLPVTDLYAAFEEYPEIIANTQYILNQSHIEFDFSEKRSENQHSYTGSMEEDVKLLRQLCLEGLDYRYPTMSDIIQARVEKELETIQQMNFVSYFLINWDIVSYAQSKGYYYVGRGSGVNSVVAYLLKITDVDPIELDLYFERFINLFRKNPPDFDIDFAWTDRDDVMRYIFERFPHVALVATYNTFKDRSVVRELGKVFGLPKEEIDRLTRSHHAQDELSSLVLKYSSYIQGFPSHLSLHPSGMVISERPVHYFSPTFISQKGYKTIQFDMHVAEDMGWYKFDILSQRGLSKIKDAVQIIGYNRPEVEPIDVHDIQRFKHDERIKGLLREADAVGCFYVESPAMRMLLRKLQVDNYLGLVAASSVIRPGVAQSGMMQEYIKRYRHPERIEKEGNVLYVLMPETFGVMVYQEDVIKVAHYFAGLTLGEADKMRRGMSGKFRSREEFAQVKEQFFETSINVKGNSYELTKEVWRQTESFAGYAFAKGHSASYAVESYQCLFLKAYYPLEFLVATINNYGGFFSTELYVLEAKRLGAKVVSICVNKSHVETMIYGTEIYLGFHLLHSLDSKMARAIVRERLQNGNFIDLQDFVDRVKISLEQITLLIRINAFRFTGKNKRQLLWEAHMKVAPAKKVNPEKSLFAVATKSYKLPELNCSPLEDAFDELELLGFTLDSYFNLLRSESQRKAVLSSELSVLNGQKVWVRGYLIHVKKTHTSQGALMGFGCFLDLDGNWLDTVHFPEVMRKYPFRGKGVYEVYGKVTAEYDCVNIEAEYMEKMEIIEDPRYSVTAPKLPSNGIVVNNDRIDYWQKNRK